jgi:outer membrane protein
MKVNLIRSALLAVLLQMGLYSQLYAQQQYTLQECVDYALEHNLEVQTQELNVVTGEINSFQSKMELLPSVNGSVQYGYNWGRSINPETNVVTRQQQTNGFGSLSASINLFNGGRVINTIKQNEANLQSRHYDLETSKNNVVLNIITYYTNVIFNKELLENAKSQLASTATQLDRTRKQVDAGALPISSLMDMQAQQATNELNVITAENALNLSLLQLKQAMLLPGNVELDVVVPDIELSEADIVGLEAETVYETAEAILPEIRSADLQIESAERGISVAKGNYYPRLTLSGGINTNYSSLIADRGLIEKTGTFSNVPIGFVENSLETVLTQVEDRVANDYPVDQILGDNVGQ